MNCVLIFIPTYNEKDNIRPLYQKIKQLDSTFDVLLLDDNSPDGTGDVIDSIAKEDPCVKTIHRMGKLGIGSAHKVGIRYAYDHGYKKLITMDADFTHDPALIPKMLAVSDSSDLVIPSRYLEEGSLSEWNPFRKLMTRMGHILTYSLLGLKNDATGAYRLYCLSRIPKGFLELVESNGYSFFFESLFVLCRNGITVHEVPVCLPKRTYGSSKMSYREIFRSIRQLLALAIQAYFNPHAKDL